MKKFVPAFLLLAMLYPATVHAQAPLPATTPHGVALTFFASTTGQAISGYQVYRCFGTCAQSSTQWILVSGSTLIAQPTTGTVTFLDSATGPEAPNLNTQYSYVVAAVGTTGVLAYSNIIQYTTPTAWPTSGVTFTTALGAIVQ